MKKLILFIILLFLYPGAMFAQQLSFRFANPRIIRLSAVDHLQFDVQVKCNQTGKFLWAGTVKLNFNNTTFNNTASTWAVATIGAFSGSNSGSGLKYTIAKTITGSVYNIALLGDVNVKGNGPSADDFAEIPSDWTTMIIVSARLLDPSGDALAEIDFLESGMNGFEQYISAPDVIDSKFTNPNLFDSRDFMTAYTGRFFSTSKGWSQVGGGTNNVQYSNLATPVSTTIWEGNAAIPAGLLSNAKNLRIDNPATLTIPVTGQLTVTGKTDIAAPGGLTIQSDATNTGSLITGSATGAGTAVVQRWMTTGAWHIVSSPLSGQTVSSFLLANGNVPLKGGNRGMMDYDPAGNKWNNFFIDATNYGSLGAGKGFSMRVGATDAVVTFTGSLQAGTLHAPASEGLWDCIGNPFTSAIGITSGSSTTDNFVTLNAGNFEPLNGAIYVWNKPDASNGNAGNYTAINNTTPPYNYLQQGQAFMVKRKAGAPTFSFTPGMQIHNPAFELKSVRNPWPTIKLAATVNSQVSSTVIAFNSAMTKGIDITYDAGLLKGGSDLVVYSGLVEDKGIPLAIQALPENDLNSMIIPVGIDFRTGGDVVFSAELLNMSPDCKVILEDKLTKTFTNLSKDVYKVAIPSNSLISDRFQLHTTNLAGGLGNETLAGQLNAYAVKNIEIRVIGEVSNNAVATLYDVQGRVVLIENLKGGSLNVIPTPNIKIGIYMLSVKDNDSLQTFKFLIRE